MMSSVYADPLKTPGVHLIKHKPVCPFCGSQLKLNLDTEDNSKNPLEQIIVYECSFRDCMMYDLVIHYDLDRPWRDGGDDQ